MNEVVTINATWFTIALVAVILSIGIAWGTMNTRITHLENRVQTNEKVLEGKASHDDMESVHVSLDRLERNLSEDVRELRRTLQTVFGISAKEYRQFDKP